MTWLLVVLMAWFWRDACFLLAALLCEDEQGGIGSHVVKGTQVALLIVWWLNCWLVVVSGPISLCFLAIFRIILAQVFIY